ncbi:hypothetical protein F5B18DRAFT_595172 [Nemania serpens]|nr:hypothetical protein F5B18DRAFT_595172 [Nemania serpens]
MPRRWLQAKDRGSVWGCLCLLGRFYALCWYIPPLNGRADLWTMELALPYTTWTTCGCLPSWTALDATKVERIRERNIGGLLGIRRGGRGPGKASGLFEMLSLG